MFEEEKEIRLHDNKCIRYAVAYAKNVVRYWNRKVHIPALEIWGSNQCNLRCKECANRIPFVHQENFDINVTINSIQKLSRIASFKKVMISGGEPFLNNELQKIILCIDGMSGVQIIYVITNATILPQEELLLALSKTTKTVKVVMNEYQGVQNKIQEIKKELKQRGISFIVRRLSCYRWNGIGNDIAQPLHFETGRMIYEDCRMRTYAVLHESVITKCPRGILRRQNEKQNDFAIEHLDISQLRNNVLSRAKLATCLDHNIHKEYCRMCFGLSDENPYWDDPGIQISEKQF